MVNHENANRQLNDYRGKKLFDPIQFAADQTREMMDTRQNIVGDIYSHKFSSVGTDTDDLIPKKTCVDKANQYNHKHVKTFMLA